MLKQLRHRTAESTKLNSDIACIAWEWISLLATKTRRNPTRGLPGLLTDLYRLDPYSELLEISMRYLYPLVRLHVRKYSGMISRWKKQTTREHDFQQEPESHGEEGSEDFSDNDILLPYRSIPGVGSRTNMVGSYSEPLNIDLVADLNPGQPIFNEH